MEKIVSFCIIVCLNSVASLVCPSKCDCEEKNYGLVVSCKTSNATRVVSQLPHQTTHLLITLMADQYGRWKVDFSHLPNLEILILEKGDLRAPTLQFENHGLSTNTRLRTLHSHVLLDFADTTMANLTSLEELTLSDTGKSWNDLRQLIKRSLYNKTWLHKVTFRRFTTIVSDCSELAIFKLYEIFGPLQNLSITDVDLSQNSLHLMPSKFAGVFKQLERLDISGNNLHDNYKATPLSFTSLFSQLFLSFLGMPALRDFDACCQGQYMDKYNKRLTISDLTAMSEATLRNASWKTSNGLDTVPSNERFNHAPSLEPNCYLNIRIPLGALEIVNINSIQHKGGTFLKAFLQDIDICFLANKLRILDASHLSQWRFADLQYVSFFGLHRLEVLNLQNNEFAQFHEGFFADMRSLHTLLLGGNILGSLASEANNTLYVGKNTQLRIIDLAFNSIKALPYNSFITNTKLRQINLSGNSLEIFNLNLTNLHHLEVLNLSFNKLAELSTETRKQMENLRKDNNFASTLVVDLTNNPLTCGCQYLDFISWLQQTTYVELHNKHLYTCDHPYFGVALLTEVNPHDLRDKCFPSSSKTIFLSVFLSTAITTIISLAMALYCKRWRLRYWWYLARRGWKRYIGTTDLTIYEYDVFVAYNWQDGYWVHRPLLEELEVKRGLKICIHQRDFLPGEVLEEVIVEKIQKSHKTLLVLSPNFVESNWCHFELQMARSLLFNEGKDVLVLVILKPLPAACVSRTLFQLLKRKVYLEWTEDSEGQDLFWRKLADALDEND